jgi:hypothetical protein
VQRPSANSVKIDDCCEQLSLLDRRVLVDVCVAMHSIVEKISLDVGNELIRLVYLVNGRDASGKRFTEAIRSGLFRSEFAVKRSELLYTSVLAGSLSRMIQELDGRKAHWLHQVPERSDGKMDICLNVEDGVVIWAPVCFFEFGLNCSSGQKYNQSVAHSVNLSPQLLRGCMWRSFCLPLIMLTMLDGCTFMVFAWSKAERLVARMFGKGR